MLLFGFIYYKTIKLQITLCEPHMSSRSQSVLVAVLLMSASVPIFIVGLVNMSALIFGFGVLVLGSGMILAVVRAYPVSISKMDKSFLWLKGVSRDYLATLPKWTSR